MDNNYYFPDGSVVNRAEFAAEARAATSLMAERPMKKQRCPKNHRFRPISFNEKTGAAVYACKCGIQWKRQAKFVCREPRKRNNEL